MYKGLWFLLTLKREGYCQKVFLTTYCSNRRASVSECASTPIISVRFLFIKHVSLLTTHRSRFRFWSLISNLKVTLARKHSLRQKPCNAPASKGSPSTSAWHWRGIISHYSSVIIYYKVKVYWVHWEDIHYEQEGLFLGTVSRLG